MKNTYCWSWACLSLFKEDDDGTSRVFTLKPCWLWQYWQNEFMVAIGKWSPDPFWVCEQWLKRNNLRDREGDAFLKAINRYAASCEPGEYFRLQPGFLK